MVAGWNGGWTRQVVKGVATIASFAIEGRTLKRKFQNVARMVVLALLCLPLPASAGGIFAPFILHPVRRDIPAEQIAEADRLFAQEHATREDFVVTAQDGVVLRGWKVRAAHPNGDWILLLHGRSQNRLSMIRYAEFLLGSDYSVLMMDARAHGESGGTIATYGHVERYDERSILDALTAAEHPQHIFAMGESMGAAVALQSAAIDPRIEAVIAEGAFRNLHEVIFDYAGLRVSAFLGKTFFRPVAMLAVHETEHQVGFRLDDVSPEASVAARSFPVLLISGLRDHNVPKRHAEAIFLAASGPKELWLVPKARHQKAMETAPEEFQSRVLRFFSRAQVASN
jgi:uncharacterized protein